MTDHARQNVAPAEWLARVEVDRAVRAYCELLGVRPGLPVSAALDALSRHGDHERAIESGKQKARGMTNGL